MIHYGMKKEIFCDENILKEKKQGSNMKIALAQMEVVPSEPRKNIDRMLSMIADAKSQGVDLVVFPEMCIPGYLLGDKWLLDSFCEDMMSYNDEILNASSGISIAYGNIYIDNNKEGYHPNKDGRSRKYNAIYVVQDGEYVSRLKENNILPKGIQPKTLLPNYRIFDDERYFFSLQDISKDYGIDLENLLSPFLIEVNGEKKQIAFEVCEDLWCNDYRRNNGALNITNILIDNGAEKIINLSCSPWTYLKNNARDRRIEFLAKDAGERFVPYFYVNCTGVQNNGKNFVTFDGGSTIYNSEGLPVRFAKGAYEEELIVVNDEELNAEALVREKDEKIKEKYDAIIAALKSQKYIFGSKYPKVVIGLSGGLDSSLSAALFVKSYGNENVVGLNMPTKYNSDKTKNAAKFLADRLGIEYHVVPIGDLVELNTKLLESDGKKLSSLNEENVQAKVRGASILSNYASKLWGVFPSNGNKVEVALGYATLYGDWGGFLSPLGDLTKTEVVEMSRFMNDKIFCQEIIPESLLPDELWRFSDEKIAPSAELKDAQIDPMKFGYHCALLEVITDYKKVSIEEVLEWYLEGKLCERLKISKELFDRWGLDNPEEFVKDLEWFYKTIEKNVFKRIQAPPIILTSKSAYGYDIRESILPYVETKRFKELKEKVLALGEKDD